MESLKHYLEYILVVLLIIIISLLPVAAEFVRLWRRRSRRQVT